MKQTKSSRGISLYSLGAGIGISCVFSLAAIFLGAMLICKEYVGESGITYFQIIVYFLSSFLGCFITERLSTSNKVLTCSITAIGYLIVLIGTSSLFFDGISEKVLIGIIPVLAALIVSVLWISKPYTRNKGRKHKSPRR